MRQKRIGMILKDLGSINFGEVRMTKKTRYDWKKGGIKLAKSTVYVLLAGLASVYGDHPVYLALIPVLLWIENYLKHK